MRLISLIILFCFCMPVFGQDSAKTSKPKSKKIGLLEAMRRDTAGQAFNPRKATIRSAVLPGWGQAYNKSYWKMPIVYASLGITAGVFVRNIKQYKEARDAYRNAVDGISSNDFLIPEPYYSVRTSPDVIRSFRNQVRQNVDYSVLVFLVFWGLNVADATVDAHLKSFDVSDNLSMRIKPAYNPLTKTAGVGLSFNFHSSR